MKIRLPRKTLKSLPKTLDDTYSRIRKGIPEECIEDIRRILQCLVCSFHSLDVKEIVDVVAINVEGSPYYELENRLSDPHDVLTIISGLVLGTSSERYKSIGKWRHNSLVVEGLRLAHFSVKEYLISDRASLGPKFQYAFREIDAHETLAKLCICYLL